MDSASYEDKILATSKGPQLIPIQTKKEEHRIKKFVLNTVAMFMKLFYDQFESKSL